MIATPYAFYTSIGKHPRAIQAGYWIICSDIVFWDGESAASNLPGPFLVYERINGYITNYLPFDSIQNAIRFADIIADEIEPWPNESNVRYQYQDFENFLKHHFNGD